MKYLRFFQPVLSVLLGVFLGLLVTLIAGENPVDALKAVISRVKHVHIRDCVVSEGGPGAPELQACGRGNIDLAGYIAVLHEAGIQVSANLEIIGAQDYELARVATIAAESRGYLNACLKKCGAR